MNHPHPLQSITLRPVTDDDSSFLLELYKSSRGDDLRGLGWDEARIGEFLGMQYEAQQRFHAGEYQQPNDRIVLRGEEPIGRLGYEPRENEIRCIDIALLPTYRNAGVGAHLIGQLQAEARSSNKPLRLQVIRFSRAVGLLERLGFQRISETGTHFQMEWIPS